MVNTEYWATQVPVAMHVDADTGLLAVGAVVSLIVLGALAVRNIYKIKAIKIEDFFLGSYLKFAYVSFIKPHEVSSDRGQQSALESFYAAQASIYDATRKQLLRGREDMLAMVYAQLQSGVRRPSGCKRPVWFDVGGGTGYNIEVMDKLIGIDTFFEHVYLIDLSPSLCEVARERAARLGWQNVTILCQDARAMQTQGQMADLITMSYSLSMIPDFYGVVDLLTGLLEPHGIIGICDFYVQSIVDISSRNYTGGTINRHVNWLGRMFWRTWFDADRVNLDAGRRDYIEYRFGTILSASDRNYRLGGIPYYIFIGCRREAETALASSHESIEKMDAAITESPYLSPQEFREKRSQEADIIVPRSKSYESAIVNLTSNLPLPAAFYQKHHWRIHYNDLLPKHQQFNQEYIYAFNWEDPAVDRKILDISHDDVILTITSAGDNILDYLLEGPKRIHAVDLNPNQNHLLELKCAAFAALSHQECWCLFAEGTHPDFRNRLIHKLSPHLSSHAFQFWLSNVSTFSPNGGGLYATGGSRHAINLVRWLFKAFNLTSKVRTICNVETLNEQREIWPSIRDVLLSWPLHWAVISSEWWSWKAAGVPREQRELIVNDFSENQTTISVDECTIKRNKKNVSGEAIWKYVCDTLDPVVATTQISRENYFYYICLMGKYSKKCHPRYMTPKAHAKLAKPDAFDGLRIHTDEIMEVVSRLAPGSLTIAILMDSMDWFTPPAAKSVRFPDLDTSTDSSSKTASTHAPSKSTAGDRAALNQIIAIHRVLKPGGRVLFRSAALRPWYTDIFAANGFDVECVGKRTSGKCIDRVNMYASTWLCTKIEDTTVVGRSHRRKSSLTRSPLSRGRSVIEKPIVPAAVYEEIMLPGAAME